MRSPFLLALFLSNLYLSVFSIADLLVQDDNRNIIALSNFGFNPGGYIKISLDDIKISNNQIEGDVFIFSVHTLIYSSLSETYRKFNFCHSKNHSPFDGLASEDGVQVFNLNNTVSKWEYEHDIDDGEEGFWMFYFLNCKMNSQVSFKAHIIEKNPNYNYLSAGDTSLPTVYSIMSVIYLIATIIWIKIIFKKGVVVYQPHYLMLGLIVLISLQKAIEALKYHFMKIGVDAEGWTVMFYIFAFTRGALGILLLALIASGWKFVKPILLERDKKILMIILPIQFLSNLATVIRDETAVGSVDRYISTRLLPYLDLICIGIIIWAVFQTRKHLMEAMGTDGKAAANLSKYKKIGAFYILTIGYLYITRIIIQILKASLLYTYVNWANELFNELITLSFYVIVGYQFRPVPNHIYSRVGDDDDDRSDSEHHERVPLEDVRVNLQNIE